MRRRFSGEEPADAQERFAEQVAKVFQRESPRLSTSAQSRHLAQLRARAQQKRVERAPARFASFGAMPSWTRIAVIALVVVLLANGVNIASASSLPGSPLYPVKRLAEQGNLWLAPNAGARAREWMNLATIRLDEVQRLRASGQRADSAAFDAIDQSILNALAEIAGTRGTERVALLRQITQLAMREQAALDQLAAQAAPDERVRFEQTSRLLNGVASLAVAAEPEPDLASSTATATTTATVEPSATSSPAPTLTRTLPNTAPPTAILAPAQAPTIEPTVEESQTPTETETEAPKAPNNDSGQPEPTEPPKTQTEKPPKPEPTEKPEGESKTPTGDKTKSPGD